MFDRFQPQGSGGTPSPAAISDTAVSGTWGGQITRQALIALAVFLVLVTVFLAFYFERAMAVVRPRHAVLDTLGASSSVGLPVEEVLTESRWAAAAELRQRFGQDNMSL